jgi:hypothetical protein
MVAQRRMEVVFCCAAVSVEETVATKIARARIMADFKAVQFFCKKARSQDPQRQ